MQTFIDANGHQVPDLNGAALTAGAVSTTAAGTIAGTTSAGAAPTVTIPAAAGIPAPNDRRGQFLLNPVTGGGSQAAGKVASVFFAQPYAAPPSAVLVSIVNQTDGTAPVTVSANNITAAGFDIYSTVLTTAKAYLVNYVVVV